MQGWESIVHVFLHTPIVPFNYKLNSYELCTKCIMFLSTTMCPLGGLYIQVTLYINYYSVSIGWSLYTGYTVHQLLQCVPWVVYLYRFHCTSTTTVCPLGGLYIQVPLCINYYSVSLGWSLHTGSTSCTSTTTVCPLGGLYIQVPLYIN